MNRIAVGEQRILPEIELQIMTALLEHRGGRLDSCPNRIIDRDNRMLQLELPPSDSADYSDQAIVSPHLCTQPIKLCFPATID